MKKVLFLTILLLSLIISFNYTFSGNNGIKNYKSNLTKNIETNIRFNTNVKKYEKFNNISVSLVTKKDKNSASGNYIIKDKKNSLKGTILIKDNKLYIESKNIYNSPLILNDKIDFNKIINNSRIINNLNVKFMYIMKKYNYSIDKNNINKIRNSFISLVENDEGLINEIEKVLKIKKKNIDKYLKMMNSISLKKVIKNKKVFFINEKDNSYIIKITGSKKGYFNIYLSNKNSLNKINSIDTKKAVIYINQSNKVKEDIIINSFRSILSFIKI